MAPSSRVALGSLGSLFEPNLPSQKSPYIHKFDNTFYINLPASSQSVEVEITEGTYTSLHVSALAAQIQVDLRAAIAASPYQASQISSTVGQADSSVEACQCTVPANTAD